MGGVVVRVGMGNVLVSVTGGVGLLTGAKGLIGKGRASASCKYHYQKICFNCHQLTCRLIPSYYSFTSKLIQKNFSCTVTVHNAQ
jgi:hypothetical protein